MHVSGRLLLPFALSLALVTAGCGDPPDKEMQQAEGAIAAARAAGADIYAADELRAAEDTLKHAHEAVAARDYRLALSQALDSRERAENAARLSADQKAAARVEADRAISEAAIALALAQTKLKAAEAREPLRRNVLRGEQLPPS